MFFAAGFYLLSTSSRYMEKEEERFLCFKSSFLAFARCHWKKMLAKTAAESKSIFRIIILYHLVIKEMYVQVYYLISAAPETWYSNKKVTLAVFLNFMTLAGHKWMKMKSRRKLCKSKDDRKGEITFFIFFSFAEIRPSATWIIGEYRTSNKFCSEMYTPSQS